MPSKSIVKAKKKTKSLVEPARKPRVYTFDLEATNLAANIGFIVCACVQDVDTKQLWTYRIDRTKEWKREKWNDKGVLVPLMAKLAEADVIVGHYAQRFDVPYIRTRALVHGLGDLAPVPLIDTWRVARNGLKLHSNRLQSLIDLLGKKDKTTLKLPIWTKAATGDKKSIQYIVDHCIVDTEELSEVYLELRYLIKDHPNVALISPAHDGNHCPVCHSTKLQRRGYRIARTRRSPRYQCQSCGHWSSGKSEKVLGVDVK